MNILKAFPFNMAKETPFTDVEMPVHWDHNELYDDIYRVGRIIRTLAGEDLGFMSEPYWNEDAQFFNTEEEAKAWLVAMYKMGGANEPRKHRRPAAK